MATATIQKTDQNSERQYYIDWLRILLIFSVFLFHIGMIFNSWDWHVKNDVTTGSKSVLWYIMVFMHEWRMPLLILISGAGTYFALGKRTSWQYLGERFKRLFIPLAVGIFTLVPVQVYIEKSAQFDSLLAYYPHMFEGIYPEGNFSWHHLWFIAYLFFIALIIAPFLNFFRSGQYDLFIGKLGKVVSKKFGANIFLIPMILSQALLRPYYPENTHALVDDWAAISYYIIFFMSGFILLSSKNMTESIRKQRRMFFIESVIVTTMLLTIPYMFTEPFYRNMTWDILEPFVAWSVGMTAIGYARQYLNMNNKFRKLANEAIYPFYLLHQPVIVVIGYYMVKWDVSVLSKVLLITLASFSLTVAIYWYLIRPFNALRLIFGMKMTLKTKPEPISALTPNPISETENKYLSDKELQNFNLCTIKSKTMKKVTMTIVAGIISAILFAQDYTQTVKGQITDADNQVTLPGAAIILVGSDPLIGTTSDMEGNFRLEKVPAGRQSFEVSYLGYEKVYLNEVLVGTGREVVLNIAMKESVTKLAEVIVVANKDKGEAINQMATVSATQLTVESTSRIAAGINDPGRTAQSFAGVSSADDENNELVIRGNSPRGMLWRMEGIEIPNPNHFSNGEGGSGGGVCALSTQVLANSDFFTGAFPAEYGNALSGVFDLNLRRGNYEKNEYALQFGIMGAQASAEGPFKRGSEASYLFNYRYSTLELLNKAGIAISGGDIAPEWQDLSFKVYIPTKKAGYLSIWGLGGISAAGSTTIRDTSEWKYRSDAYEDSEKHTIGITGVTHNYLFKNRKTYIKTVAAYSYTKNNLSEDSLSYDFVPSLITNEDFIYNTFSISSFVNHKFNAKNVLRIGLIYHNKSFDFKMLDYDYETEILEKLIDNNGSTNLYESYIQWQHRINENLDINSGLHYTYIALNNDYAVEPRFGLKWKINETHTINFGTGMHSKPEPVSIYLAEKQLDDGSIINPNKNVKITKAVHGVLGYNWNFAKDFRLKAEIYYQYLYDVPVKPDDTTNVLCSLNFGSGFTNEKFVNEGTGRNYGSELTLEKFFSKSWYMLATASVFESKYTMPDGIERNTMFNSKYIFNLVGGKEFKVGKSKQNIIGTNIRTMWRGGYRTVPVDLAASKAQNDDIRIYERAFETKAPDYFRVDIGISFRKNNPTWSWVVSLDIQNLTNRLNIWDEYYNAETGEMVQVNMVGMIPVLNYRIEF
jgi:peptidoglycan/LPS O-acetylase OafA/YrhL